MATFSYPQQQQSGQQQFSRMSNLLRQTRPQWSMPSPTPYKPNRGASSQTSQTSAPRRDDRLQSIKDRERSSRNTSSVSQQARPPRPGAYQGTGTNVNHWLNMLQGDEFDVNEFLRLLGGWG